MYIYSAGQGCTSRRHASPKGITFTYDDNTAQAEQSTMVCGPWLQVAGPVVMVALGGTR